jgi:hypothetical protein
MFPKLHTIYIRNIYIILEGNQIKNVEKGDLERFICLKRIDFHCIFVAICRWVPFEPFGNEK